MISVGGKALTCNPHRAILRCFKLQNLSKYGLQHSCEHMQDLKYYS